MPVIVKQKEDIYGTVSIPALNTPVAVLEKGPLEDDYIVEGYLDLSVLESGDAFEVREYIAVDGTNYRIFLRCAFQGPVGEPVIRFHTKTLLSFMKYKVEVVQTSGTPRSIPYGFVVEVLGTL